jgi:hypothetical protein
MDVLTESKTPTTEPAIAWPTTSIPTRGVVYVATGKRFVDEARQAASVLRRTNPKLAICLVTNEPSGEPFWDELVIVKNPYFGFRDKVFMGLCPFERFFFLDTDTHVVGDLTEVFDLLDHFDFAGHQLFEGHDCTPPGIPDSFPEFNTGVLLFRRTPALAGFFETWKANYDAYHALNRDGHYDYSNVSDQKSFRKTVYESKIRMAVLGPEYNFVPHHLNFACAPVSIIHGRGQKTIEELDRRLNAKYGNRVYVPRLDTVISNDTPPGELWQLWRMASLQLIRVIGVRIVPMGLRNWLRRSAVVRHLFLRGRFGNMELDRDKKWQRTPTQPS